MPKMSQIAMMTGDVVYLHLNILSLSLYKDMPIPEIKELMSIGEARRYLTELCIKNEEAKSKLESISDQVSDQEQSPQRCSYDNSLSVHVNLSDSKISELESRNWSQVAIQNSVQRSEELSEMDISNMSKVQILRTKMNLPRFALVRNGRQKSLNIGYHGSSYLLASKKALNKQGLW